MHELIHRNKNHPCIVMGSLSNEPDTSQEASNGYFKDIFESGLW
ncbi:glycoside hydrolase family 2 TIM barrel-domain containing protein [Aliivibrio finisterrensis]|nr:glycoside hydrolase family 2 TIM barrel-domain containing protein [Aliivibrio finisterrensis]